MGVTSPNNEQEIGLKDLLKVLYETIQSNQERIQGQDLELREVRGSLQGLSNTMATITQKIDRMEADMKQIREKVDKVIALEFEMKSLTQKLSEFTAWKTQVDTHLTPGDLGELKRTGNQLRIDVEGLKKDLAVRAMIVGGSGGGVIGAVASYISNHLK